MKRLDRFWGLWMGPLMLVMACQESDLPIGEVPDDDDGASEGGKPGGGHAGAGGSPTAGAGNVGNVAGTTGNTGPLVDYEGPTADSIFILESADGTQPTPPMLAAVDGGVMVAGASADPELMGLDAFDAGIESEAFAGRLTVEGFVWGTPLLSSGLPSSIARTPDGDFVIDGAYAPEEARVSPTEVTTSRVLHRVSGAGTIVYDRRIAFDSEMVGNSLAVSSDGSVYLGGGKDITQPLVNITETAVLAKCTEWGANLWQKEFADGSNVSPRSIDAVATLDDGDVLAAGKLRLWSAARPEEGVYQDEFVVLARFDPEGEEVWRLTATGSPTLTAVLPLPGEDLLVAGSASEDFRLGNADVDVPDPDPDEHIVSSISSFIARFGANGALRWLTIDPASYYPRALTTDGAGTGFVALLPDLGEQTERVYLRSFDLQTGEFRQSFKTAGNEYTYASSVAYSAGRLWIAGGFHGSARFGDVTYERPAGVFVAHLAPED